MDGGRRPTAELAFHAAAPMARRDAAPFRCASTTSRSRTRSSSQGEDDRRRAPSPNVLVNQLGYLPGAAEAGDDGRARSRRRCRVGAARRTGERGRARARRSPFGADAASGEEVHIIDFSTVHGARRRLHAAGRRRREPPFAIAPTCTRGCRRRARVSSTTSAAASRSRCRTRASRNGRGRRATSASSANTATRPCRARRQLGCDYTLDVARRLVRRGRPRQVRRQRRHLGVDAAEPVRARACVGSDGAASRDGKLDIPEKQERRARPAGRGALGARVLAEDAGARRAAAGRHGAPQDPRRGVDGSCGTAPRRGPEPRFLHPPSTAATLNLAAVAAQGARMWQTIDPAFSKCLRRPSKRVGGGAREPGASRAGTAATGRRPVRRQRSARRVLLGGGRAVRHHRRRPKYNDRARAFAALRSVPPTDATGMATSMTWDTSTRWGRSRSRSCPNGLGAGRRDASASAAIARGRRYLDATRQPGLPAALRAGGDGKYPWGSNSFVLNNAIVLGARARLHRATRKYLDGVVEGMDYMLGRNPLDQSYVTGYGARPLQNPHHRFWCAPGRTPKYPPPPPGVVSGGPNSASRGPVRAGGGAGGLRAAEVLHRPHRVVVDQRGHDQLERAARVGRRVPRREGERRGQEAGRREEVGSRQVPSPRSAGRGLGRGARPTVAPG